MSGEVIFYCPCNGTKHYFNETFIGQVSLYELGSGARRTMANGVNGPYLKMPSNAFDFLFETSMPTTLTIEWWQQNISDFGCVMMPSNLSDGEKLQTQVNADDEKFTSIYFENRNGDLRISLNNILNNQWTHIAYTQDYVNNRTYCHVNGIYKGSNSTNNNQYSWKLFCIGGKSSSTSSASEFFGGDIDEVIITNGAKYPFGQDFIPSTEAPSLTGLSQGGQEEPAEQYEYISNITLSGTNRLIKSKVVEETNKSSNIKEWVGTRQEYDSILLKDNYTKYIITDDGGEGFSVDNALSTTSANPVENRVITNAIQNMAVAKTRIVGEIIESTIPLTDAGLHLLDGSIIIGNGVYSEFVTYMAGLVNTHPEIFTTETNWQNSVSAFSVCNKYVYNSQDNTIRLPNISTANRYLIDSYKDGSSWYNIYSDGWCEQGSSRPAISGDASATIDLLIEFADTNYQVFDMAIASNKTGNARAGCMLGTRTTTNFVLWQDTYTDEGGVWEAKGYIDTTNLALNQIYEYVVIATTSNTQVEVDINEIISDLNTKVSTRDLDEVQCVVETYNNGSSWYRVYSDRWCEQGGYVDSGVGAVDSGSQVTFLKEFVDTNYTITFLSSHTDTSTNTVAVQYGNYYYGCYYPSSKATTGIMLRGRGTWKAEGYII